MPGRHVIAERIRSFLPGRHLTGFPLRQALRDYDGGALRDDMVAGLNVALLAIPQGMAYAMIAGLPHEAAGILCAAVATLLGPLFSSSRFAILGPTNATALMVFSSMAAFGAADRALLLPVLVFMAGLMLIAGAGLRMAELIQYISRSVIVGYITGAGLLIAAGQLKEALGIPATGSNTTFFTMLYSAVKNMESASLWAAGLSLLTVSCYYVIRKLAPRLPAFALALTVSGFLAALVRGMGGQVDMLHAFSVGDLVPRVPALVSSRALEAYAFLIGPALAIAFLAALENTVMSKSLTGKTGLQMDLNQNLFASGIANLGCACTGGMAASDSLTRTGLNYASGARTPVSSLVCGGLCLTAALTLGPVVPYLPRAGLAALLICVAVSLINRRHLRVCWRATRSDAITLAITFFSTLLMPLHVAIFVGVAASVVLYLRKAARPMLVEYEFNADGALHERRQTGGRREPAISIVHVEGELFFGAAELFRTQIQLTARDPDLRVIILRMKNARHLDATSVMALEELVGFLRAGDRHLLISGLSKEVYRVLRNSGMVEVVGRDNLFMGSAENPNLSTRNALKRAQQLLGTAKAEVRIFYDPQKS